MNPMRTKLLYDCSWEEFISYWMLYQIWHNLVLVAIYWQSRKHSWQLIMVKIIVLIIIIESKNDYLEGTLSLNFEKELTVAILKWPAF